MELNRIMSNDQVSCLNNQLSEGLSKLNVKFRKKEKLSNLPPLSSYKEGVDNHINILADDSLLSRALRVEDELPFEHSVHGFFNTIRGFWGYIASKEKDYRFRHYTGNRLKHLTRDAEKVVVEDYRSQIVKAVYERLTQYPELFDVIKNNTLPIDCYFTRPDGKKTRPVYCDWYLKGINLIFNSVKEGKELDLTVLDTLHSHKHNVKPIRITKSGILKDNFTSSISDFKIWICNPTSRIRLSCYKRAYDLIKVLEETLNNSNTENTELVKLVEAFLSKNNNENLRYKTTNKAGENYYETLLNVNRVEGDQELFDAALNAFMLVQYSCKKEEGLSNAISKFIVNDGSNDITVSYGNFLEHLKNYMPLEYVELLYQEYSLDNRFLKEYLLFNKTKAVKNIKDILNDISIDDKPLELIKQHIDNDSFIKESSVLDSLMSKIDTSNMKPYELDILNNRLRNVATVIAVYVNFIKLNNDREEEFVKEIEPVNGEINKFLDEVRDDLNKALDNC